jgi:hypothetical protein
MFQMKAFRPRSWRNRRGVIRATTTALFVGAFAVIFVASSSAIVQNSPSQFESNDGNMTLQTSGHTDWNCFVNSDGFAHNGATPAGCAVTTGATQVTADANGEISWVNGQKFDTLCPKLAVNNNPPKDEFTNVASYTDTATNLDVYFYGASIRATANGNSSGDVEFNQSTGNGTNSAGCRTAGDRLIAYDFLNGGVGLSFHVLTWIDSTNSTAGGNSGKCLVKTDTMPCWGAFIITPDSTLFDGQANQSPITAANNGMSNKALAVQQFAEFGINLSQALDLSGQCLSFPQEVWESRSSGSSFTSNPQDIEIEHQTIDNCGSVSVTKVGSDGGSQAGAVFTLYNGTGTGGTVVGSCTVAADGTCSDPSFSGLNPGTYTLDESSTPAGYGTDPLLPDTFTLTAGQDLALTFTDPALKGALLILKNSTKGGGAAVTNSGAVFSYDGGSVTDNGTGDEDNAVGSVCVSGLAPGGYTVNETTPPLGYGTASETDVAVTVVNGTNCTDNLPDAGATATFTDPPLSDIQVNFRDGGSGETSAVIACDNSTGTGSNTAATGWDTSRTVTGVEGATKITCTITIDP